MTVNSLITSSRIQDEQSRLDAWSPSNYYQVVGQAERFEQLWVRGPLFTYRAKDRSDIHLAASGDTVFLSGYLGPSIVRELSLFGLDLSSGQVKWQAIDEYSAIYTESQPGASIAANSRYLYVAVDGIEQSGKDELVKPGKIVAYNSSGQVVWVRTLEDARDLIMTVTDITVSAEGRWLYLLDAETGDVIRSGKTEAEDNLVWFVNDGIEYERSDSAVLQARNSQTGEVIWQTDHKLVGTPILAEDVILLNTIRRDIGVLALALESTTGSLLWEYKGVVSNIAVGNSIAYFFTDALQLVALDIKTGEILSELSFSSEREIPDNSPYFVTNKVYVATSQGVVLVYFRGSLQLFAFRFAPGP